MVKKKPGGGEAGAVFELPSPRTDGGISLESALAGRRSIREYKRTPLSLEEASQLLWAAQGITGVEGRRTAPSAGALYPLEVYLLAGHVTSLAAGLYHYRPRGHTIVKHQGGDLRGELARAAQDQDCVREAGVVLVFTAVFSRTTDEYGERGIHYVYIDLGHAAQNACLQAAALGLGAVPVGAFDDKAVRGILGLPADEKVVYLMPVGKPG
jgi:SagB-type dehydrogenase family enzyme